MSKSTHIKGSHYIVAIDGLRAIAVLAVLVYHLAPSALPGGLVGVDIFFVISGYVITGSLVGREGQSLTRFILGFYARRILRILPALLVCILAVSIFAVLFVPYGSWLGAANRNTAVYAIFGLSNYALIWFNDGYFSPRAEFNPFTHTWSLAVEEQFYLIIPAMVYWWIKLRCQTGTLAPPLRLVILLALISLGIGAYQTSSDPDSAFYLLPSRLWELAAGVLLFQYHHQHTNDWGHRGAIVGLALIICTLLFIDKSLFPVPWALAPVVGTLLLINSFVQQGKASAVESLLSTCPLVYIGKISYSLYLWHWPVFVMLRWTIGLDHTLVLVGAIVASFVLAAASYHLVEQPFRNAKPIVIRPHIQIVGFGLAAIAIFYLATGKVYAEANRISLSVTKNIEVWDPFAIPKNSSTKNCNVKVRRYDLPEEVTVIGLIPTKCKHERGTDKKIFVIGDSHAEAYKRMLFELSRANRVEIWIYRMPRCGVTRLFERTKKIPQHCRKFFPIAALDVKAKGKPGDMVFFASLRVERLAKQWGIFDVRKVLAEQDSDMASQSREATLNRARENIRQILQAGFHVLIVAPKPIFRSIAFRCSDWFNKINPICLGGTEVSKTFLLYHRRHAMRALSKLKKEFPEISVWDPFHPLCPGEQCSSWDGDKPLFFDSDHLTGHGNLILYPIFRERVENIWARHLPH